MTGKTERAAGKPIEPDPRLRNPHPRNLPVKGVPSPPGTQPKTPPPKTGKT
jgi:hypothetical protein